MNTFADYEAWKAKRQSAGVGAASVVIGAQEQSPDQLAGDLNLASEFGKVTGNPVPPVPMVGEYRSVFQAAIEKKRAETILSSSPRLTEWLRNPENAGVARDDLEGLSWWETGLGATWNATKRGAMRAGPQAYNQYQANVYAERAQDAGRSFGEILRDERTPILNAEGKEVDRVWAGPSDLLGAGYRYAASRLTNLWGQTAEENAAQYQARAGQIANRIAQIPMSPGGEAGKARFMEAAKAEGWQAQLSAIGKAFTEAPGEMTSFLLQTAAESLPSMAAAAGVGVATRSPGAAAAVMGSTSFAAEYGSAPVEFFKEKGIDVSTPEGAMSVIRNPEIMREAEQRGITRGVIIGALDGLSGGIAGTKLAESALGNIVLQSITQAVLGAGGEAGAQVAAGQNFNLAEVVLEGLAEFVTAPVEVGSMAVSRVREVQAKARDAEARVGLFQELSGQAVASKLRARMPDRFRQFIEQATANGPVENVFVPAQEFVTYFQSVGVDPYELLGELDGVSRDDLDAALAGGGDLRIPTATYAAKIAGSEHDAFLMQNMRFDPMDMTAREAAEFNARVDEVMAEMWAEAEDVRLEDEKWRAVEAKIYDDMVSRLRMAGRSTEVATTEAMIYPAFYRVMAERSGLSTEEFLERYPLPQVQGAVPQGMQFKNVDDLNRTLAELRSRVKPTTKQTPLLDFIAKRGGIDDVGGELKARNADGQLRPGMGRLARRLTEDGKPMPLTDAEMKSGVRFGWDYTAQAAVEAGFMADNPAVIEWKDAMAKGDRVAPDLIPVLLEEIDRELAGQGGTVDENTAALDEMEEYLSRLGVSLDDSDEAIRAVLEAAQAEDARMYGQDGEVRSAADVGSGPTAAMDAVISSLGGEVISRSYDVSGFGDEVVLRVNGTDLQLSVREDALGVYLTSIASKKAGDLTEARSGSGVGSAAMAALKSYADKTGKPFAVVGATEPARGFYEKMGMSPADVTLFMDDGYLTSPASGEGGGGFVYRPAGSSQIATESDAFKAWFGDSVVTDADGKPLVVYHGTDAEDFSAFKPGSWFSASQSEASAYSFAYEIGRRERAMGKYTAVSMADLAGSRLEYGGSVSDFEGPEVGDTFATDDGVMRYRGKGRWEVATDLSLDYETIEWADDGSGTVAVASGDNASKAQGIVDEYDGAAARMFPNGDGGRVLPVYLSIQNPIKLPALEANRIANRLGMGDADIERVIAEYEAQGYDGIETESDEATTFAEVRAAEGGIPKQWVAFRPEQVKSVFNRGTFDPADPRILYQRGGALDGLLASVRENMARKASLSADLAAAGRPVMFSTADGRRAMAGPDMSKPGGFRLTYLGADGQPSGHSEFATLAEAIRRALDEGMEPSVAYQQAQDQDQPLYVVHNLSAEKLRHAADLGGLAAPSIAVARGDIGFNSFGEISLIGEPSMADPKKKGVRLFNADVYSPRQPRARYKVDKKAAAALNATLRPVAEKLGLEFSGIGTDDIERDGLSAVNGQMVAKAAWLDSIGETVPVVREAPEPAPKPIAGYEAFTSTDWFDLKNDPAFAEAVKTSRLKMAEDRRATNPNLANRMIANTLDENGDLKGDTLVYEAREVARRNRDIAEYKPSPLGPVDKWNTASAIDKQIGGRIGDFNGWVREKFGGVLGSAFFETEAGRKKEYTLSNLVREMTRTIRNGESWNYGAGNVRAAVAPEFKGLAEVKAARGQIIEGASMDALKDEVGDKLTALADKFKPFAGSEGGYFGWYDNFSEFLRDVAKGPRAVAEWPWAANVPDDLMAEAVAFLESLKSLPTNYFEIKMQRAVDLSEFTAALVPSDLAADARKILTDAGVELVEYQKGDDGEGRNAALQQIGQRVFFQRAEGPRGLIQLGQGGVASGEAMIRLFESANLSTMLHESGHFFLLVMQDLAAKGETNAAAEYEAVKGWWRENAKAVAADGNRAAGSVAGAYNQGGRTDTASDAFKAWFGDSKVVDADGKPLVVYHGTAADFEAFSKSADAKHIDLPGFFFTPETWIADNFSESASRKPFRDDAGYIAGFENANVIPTYLSIKNPAEINLNDRETGRMSRASDVRAMLEKAQADGHDGAVIRGWSDGSGDVQWVAFSPTQIKSVFNRGTFDPADPRILYQDRTDPSLTGEKITITAEDVIRALDTGTTGDSVKDMLVDVGMQEQWARAFEAYLMEGKAPSVELRSAFEKFRAWLISVYRRIAGLNVQISDDIRAVFDRMLASDAEIEKAKRTSGDTGNMFASVEEMGLTAEEYDRFLKLRAQAEDDAKARLMGEIMDPIKREADKAYRAEKEKVRAEVERNINASPVFRALEWMGNRRWLGEGQPANLPDMRLSKAVLVQRYGEGVLKTLPRGKQTIYAVEGGLDPDDAAGWFGFDSGDQMIRALERAPGRKDAITAETDRVMNERHNDPLTDGEIERRALDAVHNDKRGQWIAAELEAVRKVIGSGVGLTAKEARASARQTIARMTVRDATAAQRFLAAERKAAEEAYQLAGKLSQQDYWENRAKFMKADPQGRPVQTAEQADMIARLYAAKRRQLMNHALYMEARAVADEVGKAERFVRNLNKASTREKIAGAGRRENAQTDYLAALDEILDRYDFRKMSGRAEDRRGALAAFIESMTAAGRENELAIPEAVLRDAGRKPYKTLSVEELRGVIDSLKNIQHVATRWNDLIDGQNQRKLDEAVAEITAAFDENMPKRPPGRVATTGEGVRNSVRQFLDLVLNAGTILREIDGFKDMGAAYRNLKAPIDAAMDRLTVRKEKAAADLEALYAVYSKEERRRMAVREHIPALGYALSKWERIAVALNTGNEGNMQRLTDPRVRGSLTPAQVAAVLSTLDERDASFVQSVWDYVGSFRDDIAAREKRTTGVEPAWVEASPVVIGGMTLRGGYYPLKYDPRLSTLARDDEAQAIGEALQAGRFGKAQTKRGHLEARAKSSGRDVELDMSVLHRHVNQVIYDLELSEPVANSWKVLQSGGVRQAFMDAGRQADFDALETWLKDVAEGQLGAGDWINKNARRFKSNFTAAKLAFNIGTVAAQITGLSQTMVVVGKRDFLRGLQASFRAGVADEITAKSAFMRQRQTTFNKDIADFYNDPKLGPYASRWGDIKRDWIGPASFWLMTKVQWFTVDIPTWLAGYQQGLRKYGGDEAKAIAHADAIVKRAQASGLFSDRSAIERGSVSRTTRQNDVVRLFTTLGSYMFAKFNVAYERTMVAGRMVREEGVSVKSAQEAASWALDVAFLFTLEAVAMAALKGKLPDDEDDEDEPGWAKFLAKETAMSVLGTIPFVRDVVSVGSGFEGGGAYGGITAEIAKPFQEIGQGEIDKGFVKSVISGTGLFTGLPSTQINRAVDAGWRAAEGEDVSPLEYLLGKRGK